MFLPCETRPQREKPASDEATEHGEHQLDGPCCATKHEPSGLREHAPVVIKPNDVNVNRPQRVLVRQTYRALRSGGFSRVRAHMTVRTLIDVGYLVGRTDAQVQRQWGIDKLGSSVED